MGRSRASRSFASTTKRSLGSRTPSAARLLGRKPARTGAVGGAGRGRFRFARRAAPAGRPVFAARHGRLVPPPAPVYIATTGRWRERNARAQGRNPGGVAGCSRGAREARGRARRAGTQGQGNAPRASVGPGGEGVCVR